MKSALSSCSVLVLAHRRPDGAPVALTSQQSTTRRAGGRELEKRLYEGCDSSRDKLGKRLALANNQRQKGPANYLMVVSVASQLIIAAFIGVDAVVVFGPST